MKREFFNSICMAAFSFLICLTLILVGCRGGTEDENEAKNDGNQSEQLDWERWDKLGEDVASLPVFDLRTLRQKATAGTLLEKFRAVRDRRLRQKMLLHEGGNAETEKAVTLGLNWLVKHQAKDGHWSIDEFHRGVVGCTCGSLRETEERFGWYGLGLDGSVGKWSDSYQGSTQVGDSPRAKMVAWCIKKKMAICGQDSLKKECTATVKRLKFCVKPMR